MSNIKKTLTQYQKTYSLKPEFSENPGNEKKRKYIETYRLEKHLKKNKIPFMNIRTDYSLEDTEQMRVRIEAFIETLE